MEERCIVPCSQVHIPLPLLSRPVPPAHPPWVGPCYTNKQSRNGPLIRTQSHEGNSSVEVQVDSNLDELLRIKPVNTVCPLPLVSRYVPGHVYRKMGLSWRISREEWQSSLEACVSNGVSSLIQTGILGALVERGMCLSLKPSRVPDG